MTDMRERVARALHNAHHKDDGAWEGCVPSYRVYWLEQADAAIEATGAAKMLDALKMVMQHGRIDDSEERMNHIASIIAQVEGTQDVLCD